MMSEPVSSEQPVLNIEGELVALGPQRRELVSLYLAWLNRFAVMAPLGMPLRPLTHEEEVRQYEETSAARDQAWFTMYERATMRPIGITGLRDIDHAHCRAEFVIFIGERDCWGKGYGTETARLMLDYGFNGLGLHTVLLRVFSTNVRGIRAYTRAGFREIGRWREAQRWGQDVADVVFMDCLAREFRSPVLKRMLVDEDSSVGSV